MVSLHYGLRFQLGFLRGSISGPLFFLIYITDLSYELSSTTKIITDDTSLFSVVHDVTQSTNVFNDDLENISNWAHQWKMSFNPDKSKQAQEVIFPRKTQKVNHPPANFKNIPVVCSSCQKHLGVYLDDKLNFIYHINKKNFKSKQRYRYHKKIV